MGFMGRSPRATTTRGGRRCWARPARSPASAARRRSTTRSSSTRFARAASGWLFNFSGTGGIWRAKAIETAGGWQHDTLTEDLDLSYRAQIAGGKFIYRENVGTPAGPPEASRPVRAPPHRRRRMPT